LKQSEGNGDVVSLKDVELKVMAELMKNSRRSDRELAKTLKISQPTVTRIRSRFEKEDYLKEYTVIPNFVKLGFQIAAITLVRVREDLTEEQLKQAQQITSRDMKENAPDEIVFFQRGMGGGFSGVLCSFHKTYSEYMELVNRMKAYSFVNPSETLSFLIDLNDKIQYRNFTFSTLANCCEQMKQ